MDQVIVDLIDAVNAMAPDEISGKGARRFLNAIEVPLSAHLGLHVPRSKQDLENVYVTWVEAQNNIDNRLWQVQNKLMKGMNPRIAVALCSAGIAEDAMWLDSAKNLSRVAPYLSTNNFDGLLLLATDDGRETFTPKRLILLRGSRIARELADALPEIRVEWYSVPLATRRPLTRVASDGSDEILRRLRAHRNVILKGVSGIGKSHVLGPIAAAFGEENVELVVFHPNSTYEDFVEALRPGSNGSFGVVDGRFLAFCKKAASFPDRSFLFIIDEINRAPAARVLGDLLYAIDPSKRMNAATANVVLNFDKSTNQLNIEADLSSRPVTLQLERTGPAGPYRALFCVPDNVFILGTRNTSDHSIGSMDIALSRRFHTVRIEPFTADELLKVLCQGDERLSFLESEARAWGQINELLRLTSPDACLGHSYFFDAIRAASHLAEDDDEELITTFLWRDYLLPQLGEILETFDAEALLPALSEAVRISTSQTSGYWIEPRGEGLDRTYLVVPRSDGQRIPVSSQTSLTDVPMLIEGIDTPETTTR